MAKDQRVSVMLAENELKAIEDWRRQQETVPSRSEAVRRLIGLGAAEDAISDEAALPDIPDDAEPYDGAPV